MLSTPRKRRPIPAWGVGVVVVCAATAATARPMPADVCLGRDAVFVLDQQGTLWAWGGSIGNGDGQLGLGDDNELAFLAGENGGSFSHFAATKVGAGYASIACGERQTAAITPNGDLWMWGGGLIGDGSSSSEHGPHYRPVQIGPGYAQIALGEDYALALKTDGSLWAWGDNKYGQLGDGTKEPRLRPVQIGTGYQRVAAGYFHSAAIRKDGSLWTWGRNSVGQLGTGESGSEGPAPESLVPVRVGQDFMEVAVGGSYTAAIKRNGDLMAWGASRHGFGRGVEEDSSTTPVKIGADFMRIVMDHSHSLALQRDGTVWEWGWRTQGERNLQPVSMGAGFKRIAAHGDASAGIKNDNTLWLWGGNDWQFLVDKGRYPDMLERKKGYYLTQPTAVEFPLAARK